MWTKIRLPLQKQSGLGLSCLLKCWLQQILSQVMPCHQICVIRHPLKVHAQLSSGAEYPMLGVDLGSAALMNT